MQQRLPLARGGGSGAAQAVHQQYASQIGQAHSQESGGRALPSDEAAGEEGADNAADPLGQGYQSDAVDGAAGADDVIDIDLAGGHIEGLGYAHQEGGKEEEPDQQGQAADLRGQAAVK